MTEYRFTCQDCDETITVQGVDLDDARDQAATDHIVRDGCEGELA